LTNLISTSGGAHQDWSAHYRLYERHRINEKALFATARHELEQNLAPEQPLVVSVDDTLTRKRGKHIAGSGWKRDPLGPPFQTNLVWGQRYVQLSAAWPLGEGRAQSIPIDFMHAPSAAALPRQATEQQRQARREEQKQRNLNTYALQSLHDLRRSVSRQRPILVCGDGSYTNQSMLRGLPQHTHYLGRTRKDIVLHYEPSAPAPGQSGRRPSYGARAPTPEALRQDDEHPWQSVKAHAAGKEQEFEVKELGPVLWRKSGAHQRLRLIVINTLGYRPRKGAKLQYRAPAYLLSTDLESPLAELVQHYAWRWGIEVNIRDEKQLLGVGEAQVRNAASSQHQPASLVAAYSLLHVAAIQEAQADRDSHTLAPPKWRKRSKSDKESDKRTDRLPSTGELQRQLRYEAWAEAIRPEQIDHIARGAGTHTKWEKLGMSLPGMLFHAA
jgi:DDE superfamily endonuclease